MTDKKRIKRLEKQVKILTDVLGIHVAATLNQVGFRSTEHMIHELQKVEDMRKADGKDKIK